ncbi:hypothetical protein PAHAL_8G092500 [Panicum hallii]|uniref:Uncharacterized protein n=1 Tax=Panicum hallii TaxID=206008 RepID=A0A2T8I8D8_9POAL|nr:hypothetical protein PAHAL_8G092500 [Panicum hallii]
MPSNWHRVRRPSLGCQGTGPLSWPSSCVKPHSSLSSPSHQPSPSPVPSPFLFPPATINRARAAHPRRPNPPATPALTQIPHAQASPTSTSTSPTAPTPTTTSGRPSSSFDPQNGTPLRPFHRAICSLCRRERRRGARRGPHARGPAPRRRARRLRPAALDAASPRPATSWPRRRREPLATSPAMALAGHGVALTGRTPL